MRRWWSTCLIVISLAATARAQAVAWVRGGADGSQMRWGIDEGLQFAIAPAVRGPRGLIRVLAPTLPGRKYDLVNFIAIEPILDGRRGLSELEFSQLDLTPGKRFWVDEPRGVLEKSGGGGGSVASRGACGSI